MADIRINSLPTTATSFNTDDYIALDGASGGTRKMLASTLPLTDVTFGSSGPSAKSSIAARASRQGLIFDGTAGVYTGIISGPSTNDFTTACWVNPTSFAASGYLFGNSQPGSFYLGVRVTTGALFTGKSAGASFADTTFSLTAGKNRLLVRVKSGSSVTWYLDGVAIQSGITDSNDYNGGFEYYGSANSSAAIFTGTLIPFIYNRALSAAEVVALYEAGVPAEPDYNSASNTAVYSTDFSTSTGWTAESGWSITGGAAVLSGSSAGALYRTATALSPLSRYRITFTVASYVSGGVKPWVQIGSSRVYGTARTANGTYTEELVAPSATGTSYVGVEASTSSSCSLSVDDYAYYALGLLLAPDAGQAGGGLTWYDTSGNAANITLPASGVSWNVPSSRYLGGNWTTSGNLTVSGTSGITTTATNGAGLTHSTAAGSYRGLKLQTSSSDRWLIGANDAAESGSNAGSDLVVFSYSDAGTFLSSALKLVRSTGNLLIGTTTDSSNGKLQLTSHTTSAGGIGFGPNFSVYTSATASLTLASVGSGTPHVLLNANGTDVLDVFGFNSDVYFDQKVAGKSLIFRTNGTTTALTLDSSQNATFAGTIAIGNTVNTVSPTSPNRTITMVIGGTTYYLHAKTTND